MKKFKIVALLTCMMLCLSACGPKAVYLVKQPDQAPPDNTMWECLAIAQFEMELGGAVSPTENELRLLKGVGTERFLWWGSLSGPRPVVNRNHSPTEHQSLIPVIDPYKISLAERYVLCLLQSGYMWPDEEWVKERFHMRDGIGAQQEQQNDNMPMYGQPDIPRAENLRKSDEIFIAKAAGVFEWDRRAASNALHAVGERYMSFRNTDAAMRRYNQAWLLDPDNYLPYWGFARVILYQENFDDAFRYFEKAKHLVDDKYQEVALLADFGIAFHNKARSIKDDPQKQAYYYEQANTKFRESIKIDSDYPNSWEAWGFSLYYQEKYTEAWEKIKKAQALCPGVVSEEFLKKLREKMPEPK